MSEERKYGKSLRRVVQIGESLGITLPKDYVKKLGLKKGDVVELLFDTSLKGEEIEEFFKRIENE